MENENKINQSAAVNVPSDRFASRKAAFGRGGVRVVFAAASLLGSLPIIAKGCNPPNPEQYAKNQPVPDRAAPFGSLGGDN